eukprot:3158822-Prymnesium_polylepis.2
MAGLMACFGSGFFLGTAALWRTAALRASLPFRCVHHRDAHTGRRMRCGLTAAPLTLLRRAAAA